MRIKDKKILLEQHLEIKESHTKEHSLTNLFFELTNGCNLHCLHCGSNCGPEHAKYLSIDLIKKTLESVKKNIGNKQTLVVLTGGEPLIHPQFFEITKLINSMGFDWGMTTNATLITKEVAQKLKENKILSISFSLDGNKETHDIFRGVTSSYDRCIQGIKNFVEVAGHDAVTMITSVFYKQNIDQLDELYNTAKKLGVHYWRPINVEPIGRANEHSDLFLEKEDYIKLFDFIKEKRKISGYPIVTYGCSHALPIRYELDIRQSPFFCIAGIEEASILVNGDIYGCLDIERRKELVQGNVKEDDFYDVWDNKFAFFRKDRSEYEYCRDCNHKKYCKGDSMHTWNFDENKPNLCLMKLLDIK